jgi:hypothetical protein
MAIVLLLLVILMFGLGIAAIVIGFERGNTGQACWAFNCVLWVLIAAMWMNRAGAFDSLFK